MCDAISIILPPAGARHAIAAKYHQRLIAAAKNASHESSFDQRKSSGELLDLVSNEQEQPDYRGGHSLKCLVMTGDN